MRTGTRWLSTGGLAAFAGGAVAALIASRVLPPLMAQAAGSARVKAGRDPFAELEDDHRKLLALLDRMADTRDDAVMDRTQLLLRLKRRLGAHALAEENVVYPLLHDEARQAEDADHLYGEHAEMKMHLFALEQMPKDDPRWIGRAHALRDLIARHVRQEEEVDFPRLRQVMGEREAAKMSGSMQREKALLL
ncbi:hemerythrin domain-containing protein [Arenibaculum pallidiluteum]|uniref:hemerythrin domain-containing protein n=1 Tax=Arenibaculum pallidiluteum TaxID=2812559 RepID=UPI001A967AD1|nr:hemerythrin domain-containing protein [Arenibaculum pallidiluteum]